jgi:NCS1 family nucleobase:cation symporter-1
MPDFTRFSRNQKSQMLGQILGLPTTMTFFSAIGVLITSATVVVYGEAIWDPTALLSRPEFAHPVVVVVSLISIGVATLSVNVAANVVSPAFDFANLLPRHVDFRRGGTITGVIGIAMMPWALLKTAGSYIFTWLVGYSALLGPIAGVMICDFWILRRRNLAMEDLYRRGGRYEYRRGFNWLAVISLGAGILPNLPGFLIQATGTDVESLSGWAQRLASVASTVYAFAWLTGFAVAFFCYWALMAWLNPAAYETDRRGEV